MENIIIDATVVARLCLSSDWREKFAKAIGGCDSSQTKIWMYVPEIDHILNRIIDSEQGKKQANPPEFARKRLLEFSKNCKWLAGLAEDASGLVDEDPIAVGLALASRRISESTLVITECSSRLSRGKPFVDIESCGQNAFGLF